ncbi:MAG: hypothetical protein HY909_25235 [Deltaproteobacteria bacterium]|nr:hypothetical protein [Deltaproteobacteria bacterium]
MSTKAPQTEVVWGNTTPADVLIVTALREEAAAVRAVMTGALGQWTASRAPSTQLRIERRSFRAADGGDLRVALICAEEMGGAQTVGVAGPVVMALKPRCLAMCGVLAGKPRDTELGDVVIADQLIPHDTGKRTKKGFEHATRPHKLDIRWLEKARDFAQDPHDALLWLERTQWTELEERAWLLDQFSRRFDPLAHEALLSECCKSYTVLIETLWTEGLVRRGTARLTKKGEAHIRAKRMANSRWPALDQPRRSTKVRVAPIASGSAVQADPALWEELSQFARKALGVEMESHGVGTTAELHQVELALVMKGVMDNANKYKDDRIKPFAARASAECLLAFLRRYLPTGVRPGFDDLLVPGTVNLPDDPAPSQLLDAHHAVMPWHERGRTDILAELDAWADDPTHDVSVRLLHAEGGVGKTRLAIEWLRRRRLRETAGFLVGDPEPNWFERLCDPGAPISLVLDYAESRSDLSNILDRVARYRAASGNKCHLRLLLLARNDGDWWTDLRRRSTALRGWLDEVPPKELRPMATNVSDREELFREAVRVFAMLQHREVAERLPERLTDSCFERVLYLHMAALAAVENQPVEPGTLMEITLDHEERFWLQRGRNGSDNLDVGLDVPLARQMVAAATLRGGLRTEAEAHSVFENICGRRRERQDDRLLALLHHVYARSGNGAYLPGLEPDLLGESMVLRVAAPPVSGGTVVGPEWIDRVFGPSELASVLRNGFIVLGRVSVFDEVSIRPWIMQLLTRKLGPVAVLSLEAAKIIGRETPYSVLGDILAEQLELRGNVEIAAILHFMDIPTRTVSLSRVAEWTSRTMQRALPKDENRPLFVEKARRASERGHRLGALGQYTDAVEATTEAVERFQTLAASEPTEFMADYAACLDNLGVALGRLGRSKEALEAASRAVEQYRIVASRDTSLRDEFALCLMNLGAKFGIVGNWLEAFKVGSEAAELYRELTTQGRTDLLPDFASSVDNVATSLWNLRRHGQALEASSESVEIFRGLVNSNQDAYLPMIAKTLMNRCAIFTELKQYEIALSVIDEAITHYRMLTTRRPDVFIQELVCSLCNRGRVLGMLGRNTEALEVVDEAIEIQTQRKDEDSDVCRSERARALVLRAKTLVALSLRAESLDTFVEAIASTRLLILRNRGGFLPLHVQVLMDSGANLIALNQHAGALVLLSEATAGYRELAMSDPDVYRRGLCASLVLTGSALVALERYDDAIAATAEALSCGRTITTRNPESFAALTGALSAHGVALHHLQRHTEAVTIAAEARELLRPVTFREPDESLIEFIACLHNLSIYHGALNQHEDALESALKELEAFWPHFECAPKVYAPVVAFNVALAANSYENLGRDPSPVFAERVFAIQRLLGE